MSKAVLLLSGPSAVGKTSVCVELCDHHAFRKLSSSAYLKSSSGVVGRELAKAELQDLGDALDLRSNYRWVVDDVAVPAITGAPAQERWLFDSVRKAQQIDHFRGRFADIATHVHLTAREALLKQRYEERLNREGGAPGTPYEIAVGHPNEVAARGLDRWADAVIDVEGRSATDLALEILEVIRRRQP